MNHLNMVTNYIYLLQEREFIKTTENIYKVGRTKKENHVRFNQYPKGSILLFQMICNDCENIEGSIIKIFKDKFNQRKDIGNEYFEGDYNMMIDIIYTAIKYYIYIPTKSKSNEFNDNQEEEKKLLQQQKEEETKLLQQQQKEEEHKNNLTKPFIDWLMYEHKNKTLKNDNIHNLYLSYKKFEKENKYSYDISLTKFGILLKNKNNIFQFNIGYKHKSGNMKMIFDFESINKYFNKEFQVN
jgi:hypothetical protein